MEKNFLDDFEDQPVEPIVTSPSSEITIEAKDPIITKIKHEDVEINKKEDSKDVFKEDSEDKTTNEDPINFSEIKKKTVKFFKNVKKSYNKDNDTNIRDEELKEDFGLDIKQVKKTFQKHKYWLIPVILILIAILVSTNFRMGPSDLQITDNWAENSVHNFYKNQITGQINQQYPNLPEQNRNSLIDKEFQKVLKENKAQIEADTKQLSQQFKANFQDENGDTYLLAIDPYLWFSQARNVINYGHLGDKIIDGEEYFSLRDGRLDKKSSIQLHPYIAAYTYKIMHFFNPNITLMRALFLLPVLIIGLALIPAFFIGRKFAGNTGGFFAALFLAINGPLLSRTPAGFADTDPYNILWPLLIFWLFLEAYDAQKMNHKYLFGGLSGIVVGLYAATWTGWSSSFLLVLAFLIIVILFDLVQGYLKHKKISITKKVKQLFVTGVVFIISSGIFVTLFKSFNNFTDGFTRPLKFITLKSVGIKSIWPNVLTTVAEFNTQGFSNFIGQMGGDLLFFFSLMGIIVLFARKMDKYTAYYLIGSAIFYLTIISGKDSFSNPVVLLAVLLIPVIAGGVKALYYKEDINLMYPLLLSLWLVSSAYAFTKGMRFALLIAPPFVLGLGSSFGFIYNHVSKWITKGINLNMKLSKIVVLIVLLLFVIAPFNQAESISENEVPSMNDAWFGALTLIKEDAAKAIITSWWDFGHWFVAISERMVTFDGGDQGERIHWVGKTLLSDNEEETIGVLRMLNCAQETAPHKLDEFTKDALRSTEILDEIDQIPSRTQAFKKYQELGLSKEEAAIMLEYTHCKDLIPNYYITSEDMVGKAGVWGHFGSWNFERASMYQGANKLSETEGITYLQENFDMDETEAAKIYFEIKNEAADRWISPWPGYISGVSGCDNIDENNIQCVANVQGGQIVLEIDLETMDINIPNNQEVSPNSIVYATKDKILEKKFDGTKTGFSVVLIPNGNNYRFMLTDPLQAASTFTKLFFYEGHGMKCFEKFDDRQQVTGGRIITWKVDYECEQENNVFFQPKAELAE
jgi:dolichyl-phosphooligosaccharide-protein glycotransferase